MKKAELLEEAIRLANEGNPEQFSAWQEKARMALRVTYGESDKMLDRFDEISFSPGVWSTSTPDMYSLTLEAAA